MLFRVEQAFVRRDEKRAPLKTPSWEATLYVHFQHTVECSKDGRRLLLQ